MVEVQAVAKATPQLLPLTGSVVSTPALSLETMYDAQEKVESPPLADIESAQPSCDAKPPSTEPNQPETKPRFWALDLLHDSGYLRVRMDD